MNSCSSPAGVRARDVLRQAWVEQWNKAQVHPSLLPAKPRWRGPGRAGQRVLQKCETQFRGACSFPPQLTFQELEPCCPAAVVAAGVQAGRVSASCRGELIHAPQKIKIERPGYQRAVTVAWKQLSGTANAAAWLQRDTYIESVSQKRDSNE